MSTGTPPDDLRARLSPLAFEVTQHKGTERAFTGAFTHHKERGTYGCVCCGADYGQKKAPLARGDLFLRTISF